jgi:hypothetical protein
MKEACPQTGRDDATRHQPTPFDWATDIDQSIGPVPSVSDFRPATPLQPTHTPSDRIPTAPAPTDGTPAAYTSPAPALIDPDPGDVAPRARTLATRLLTDNPVPVDPDPAAPTPATGAPTVPQARTPSIVHGPRDLSALCSGTKNPWGSIKHHRRHSYPPRDLTALRSDSVNPWGSLHHRRRRFYPLPANHIQPSSKGGNLNSQARDMDSHSELSPSNKSQHLHSSSISVHIIQTIQHPHGISSTKPKITKTIPTTPEIFHKNTWTGRCACGNTIPAYSPDQRSWRTDIRDRRFRRRFRRFWDRERGRSHVWGGAHVVVSFGSLYWCQGSSRGFGVLSCCIQSFV